MYQPAPNAVALTCPRCNAPAQPAPVAQRCASCGKSFTLRAGRLMDPSVAPQQPDPRVPNVRVKSAGLVLYKMGEVSPYGVSEGVLDPVTGLIPMDQSGVAFPDIYTVAVWRKIDVVRLLVTLFITLPITALLVAGCFATAWLLILALPFLGLLAYGFWGAIGRQAHWLRVVGAYRTVIVRFDAPFWRRQRFHDELLRRAGITPTPIP
jgi:hypothetical protein